MRSIAGMEQARARRGRQGNVFLVTARDCVKEVDGRRLAKAAARERLICHSD
jgi:hypothetical protein